MPRPSKGPHLILRKAKGFWYIRDGTKERGTGCAKEDRRGAEKKLAAYLNQKHEPNFGVGDPTKIAVTDVLALYLKEHAPTVVRKEMVDNSVLALGAFFETMMVSQISKRTCRQYVEWRTAQPDSRYKDPEKAPRIGTQTARRELEDLRAAIGYAVGENLLNYPVPVHLPEKSQARDRWLTRDEAAALIWAAWKPCWGKTRPANMRPEKWEDLKRMSQHLAKFMLATLYTGTRKTAILRLRWIPSIDSGYVDLNRGLIYRRGTREQQTSKRRTPVPISARLMPHLRRWKRSSTTHVIEFNGESIASITRSWSTAVANSGLSADVTPHTLRHTFATWAVQSGQSFGLVAGALGTSEQIVEAVYGHHHPEYLRGVVDAVGTRKKGTDSSRIRAISGTKRTEGDRNVS